MGLQEQLCRVASRTRCNIVFNRYQRLLYLKDTPLTIRISSVNGKREHFKNISLSLDTAYILQMDRLYGKHCRLLFLSCSYQTTNCYMKIPFHSKPSRSFEFPLSRHYYHFVINMESFLHNARYVEHSRIAARV